MRGMTTLRPAHLAWPLPALLDWALAWAIYLAARSAGLGPVPAFAAAFTASLPLALGGRTAWRRHLMLAGFPLSLLLTGSAALPAWVWLLPLALIAVLSPWRTWRDAPLFPTPSGALQGLPDRAPLPANARVLDGGCGLGAGLRELRAAYPQAALTGVEWSWPLAWACRARCRFARIVRGDLWAHDWRDYDLVYLFQRPESMPRAMAKAAAELRPGAWLVSLEFEAAGWRPTARCENAAGKPVWLYRAPFTTSR
jgi:SAM-dependent methyltransferase